MGRATRPEGNLMGGGFRLGVSAHEIDPAVESISEIADIQAMDRLDAIAFGDHEGIGVEALEQIRDNGVLLAVRDNNNNMIGEAQLILDPISDAKEHIVRNLKPEQAYFEGFGVHPDGQGRGIGKALLDRVLREAQDADKKELISTVRTENPASLSAMLQRDFRVVAFDPHYYPGDDGEGHRLVCRRALDVESEIDFRSPVDFKNRSPDQAVFVEVRGGDAIDEPARRQIEELLSEGRVGGVISTSSREDVFNIIFSRESARPASLLSINPSGRVIS